MRVPTRRALKALVLLQATPQEANIDYISPQTTFLAIPPKARGLTPLKEVNQIQLNFGVWALPPAATYVDFTMVKYRGLLIPPDASSITAGVIATGLPQPEIFRDQSLIFDPLTNRWRPFSITIRIDAPAPNLVINAFNYNDAGAPGAPGFPSLGGGSFSFPVQDDYVGILVESDDNQGSGKYTLSATFGNS